MAEPRDEDDDVPAGPDYLWDRSGPPDPEVARLEALLAPLAHDAPLQLPADVVSEQGPALPDRAATPQALPSTIDHARRRRVRVAIASSVVVAAAVIAFVLWPRDRGGGGGVAKGCDGGSGLAFAAEDAVRCAGGTGAKGTLAVGGWIETADGGATIQVAEIGEVALRPRSRLALRRTDSVEHRLALERGSLHARVTAPPRLFVVETPSVTAVDLGCEYDLEVAPDGSGRLVVTTGEVELATATGALVVVPAGTEATFSPARGVGLPVAVDASPVFRAAVAAWDPKDPGAVDAILSAAGDGDQVTLVNLLGLAAPYQREAVFDRLHQLAPAPEDVLRDAVIAGDADALRRWRESVVDGWNAGSFACDRHKDPTCKPPGKQRVAPHTPKPPTPPPVWTPDAPGATWGP